MSLVPENTHNQHDNENAVYYVTYHQGLLYTVSTQN
jgi:hypothetical protein